MKFDAQHEVSENQIKDLTSEFVFFDSALDERGEYIRGLLNNSANSQLIEFNYDAEEFCFKINNIKIPFRSLNSELENLLGDANKIIVDTTTIGIPELLYLLRWTQKSHRTFKVEMLYVEPRKYPPIVDSSNEFGRHTFKLSSRSLGYRSLPGFAVTTPPKTKSHLIALLGFERVRLGQLLENDEGAFIGGLTPLFGVPGFKPSYDKHSAFQNIESILSKGEKPEFSCANNPFETYQKLEYLRSCYPETIINIAPIGTKPMAIGACIFALNNIGKKVGVMYDHPIKKTGRSEGVSRVHLYSIIVN